MYRICMYKLYDTFYEVQMLSFDGLDLSGSTFSIIVDVCSPSQQQASVKKKSCLVNYKQQLRDAPNVYTRSLTCLDGH